MIITVKANIVRISNDIVPFQKQYNTVIRWAYNRFMEGKSRTDVFALLKNGEVHNVGMLDLTWKREAAKIAQQIAKSDKEQDTVSVFYSKACKRRKEGKTTREEFLKEKEQSLYWISCEGSKADNNGNRKFKFDANTMTGTVKLDGVTVEFSCDNIGPKRQRKLAKYLQLASEGRIGVTYRIKPGKFYICVDLDDIDNEGYNAVSGRTMAIDMNPNYIGLSVVDADNTIMRKEVYNMSGLPKKKDKCNHELTQIAIKIASLCKYYHVSMVGFEMLSIRSKNSNKGRRFNKLVNNDWRRNRFTNSLKKHLELIGCPYREISPEYSSFVGCVCYQDDTDSVAASLELNRRLRLFNKMYIEKTVPVGKVIYPEVGSEALNRWKEEAQLSGEVSDWKGFYDLCKKAGHSYRRLYKDWIKDNPVKEKRLCKAVGSKVLVMSVCCNEKLCFN